MSILGARRIDISTREFRCSTLIDFTCWSTAKMEEKLGMEKGKLHSLRGKEGRMEIARPLSFVKKSSVPMSRVRQELFQLKLKLSHWTRKIFLSHSPLPPFSVSSAVCFSPCSHSRQFSPSLRDSWRSKIELSRNLAKAAAQQLLALWKLAPKSQKVILIELVRKLSAPVRLLYRESAWGYDRSLLLSSLIYTCSASLLFSDRCTPVAYFSRYVPLSISNKLFQA